jgi:DnaJ-class molecular chaperone
MIEKLKGFHNVICNMEVVDKINELIDVVKEHDKQIQACMQRIIDLEDTALDTKQEKCPTCNGTGIFKNCHKLGDICTSCNGSGTMDWGLGNKLGK